MVKTYVCPVLKQTTPNSRKRKYDDHNTNNSEMKPLPQKKLEVKEMYSSIKKFNMDNSSIKEKNKGKQDLLTALGAPHLKQQKRPFKLRMGLLTAQKKRDAKEKEYGRLSGVVQVQSHSKQKEKTGRRKVKVNDDDFNIRTYGGVYRVKANE